MSEPMRFLDSRRVSSGAKDIGCTEPNLDGVVLLRYAHIYKDRISGGMERYLRQVNDGLLERHRMTILQMHLVSCHSSPSDAKVEIEKHGKGRIIWIPIGFQAGKRSIGALPKRWNTLSTFRGFMGSTEKRSKLSAIQRTLSNFCGHLRYSTMIFSEGLVDALEEYRVDLVLFHWLSYDVSSLVMEIERRQIPFAVIQHFDNRRLSEGVAARVARKAVAVGGVSNRNVPRILQDRYVNLSDAVDLSMFSPALAKKPPHPEGFMVLLPSRIALGKGHRDLLLAIKCLEEAAQNISIVFAGAAESDALVSELKREAEVLELSDRVLFLGELTPEGLRDWYAATDVVVLPSHSEGLGRVLLEAQAMEKPVIAYESGGTPEALVHGETGFIVKKGSQASLAERIRYLLHNPAERIEMGRAGQRFVAHQYSVHDLISRHQDFLFRALAGNNPPDIDR